MEFKDVYTEFNDFYYYRLKDIVSSADERGKDRYVEFLKEIDDQNIDLDKILYEKLMDDYEDVEINSRVFRLLPLGIRNRNVPEYFICDEKRKVAGRYGSLDVFETMFF